MLGVSRQGRVERRRVRKLKIRAGDVLLLLGPTERIAHVGAWIGGLALQERDLRVVKRDKARLAAALLQLQSPPLPPEWSV